MPLRGPLSTSLSSSLSIYGSYPEIIRERLLVLRSLILEVANEQDPPIVVEETIKWSEPAYLSKTGSTIRLGFPKSRPMHSPMHYAMYFNCNTSIVETIAEVYGDTFEYDGKRAIVFDINQTPDFVSLRQCILIALTYHKRKHLTLLGL